MSSPTPFSVSKSRRRPEVVRPALRVYRAVPNDADGTLVLYGAGLAEAEFTVRGVRLEPLGLASDSALLSSRAIDAAGATPLVVRGHGTIVTVDLDARLRRPGEWFRYSGPDRHLFSPTRLDQPMLVLQVVYRGVTADWSGPDGATLLQGLLDDTGPCANGFWRDASFGKTSFRFDIHPEIITLQARDDYIVQVPGTSTRWFLTASVIEDALSERTKSMSDADADRFLSSYLGVLISHAVDVGESSVGADVYWPRADSYEVVTVRGRQYALGYVMATHGWGRTDALGSWPVFAHELGHVLGFPDEYEFDHRFEGQEVQQWDIMCNGQGDATPTAWEKAYRATVPTDPSAGPSAPWIAGSEVVSVDPPSPGQTNQAEALLVPISLPLPAANPFAPTHPGIALAHAICLNLDSNRRVLVEARQVGPIPANPPFGATEYDRSIPCDGVIVTEAVDSVDLFPATRRNVNLLSPDITQPFPSWHAITIGGALSSWEDPAKRIKVELLETVQTQPKVFHVRATWGPGPAPDLFITPWSPPPWESPDIWADDEANGWDVYAHSDVTQNPGIPGHPVDNGDALAVGSRSRLYARVHNHGDAAAQNVNVEFAIVVPGGVGLPLSVGKTTVPLIAPGEAKLASVEWTPTTSSGGHVCVRAQAAVQSGEIVSINNVAQENFTDWYVKQGSPYRPVEFPFQIHNALPESRLFEVEVRGLRHGHHVEVFPRYCWLGPGETRIGRARIVVEDDVPVDSVERRPARVHLQIKAFTGCEYERVGGLSGLLHCVRKAYSEVGVIPVGREPADGRGEPVTMLDRHQRMGHPGPGAEVRTMFWTAAGPVAGAGVAVRLEDRHGRTLTVERGVTNRYGRVAIWLDAPQGFRPADEYRAVVMLHAMRDVGPEETSKIFRFKE